MKTYKKLDFIVIGAAKAGTTTLQEILSKHPDIFLPKQKELPFFSEGKLYDKGLDNFLNIAYKNADENNIIGKITPQYMDGQGTINPEIIAKRIKKDLPNVKIIAILRDPKERSLSFFRMSVRMGYEKREYSQAIEALMGTRELEADREKQTWTNTYVVGGEYGRILNYYYNNFSKDHILVLFTKDLRDNPKNTLKKLLVFIGADISKLPDNYNRKYHVGGDKPKFKYISPGYLYKIPMLEYTWNNLIPFTLRRSINQSINHWNIKKGKSDSVDPNINRINKQLEEYYKSDAKLLKKLTRSNPYWLKKS